MSVSTTGGPWRVFLSHTSELRTFPASGSYVGKLREAVSAAGHVIVEMSEFSASDAAPADVCIKRVKSCDVYVGVLGTRYGSPVRDRPAVSYTELEFETATQAGLHRMMFMLDVEAIDVGIPLSRLIDLEFGARQEAFRRRVVDAVTVQAFQNPHQLQTLVERSLRDLRDELRPSFPAYPGTPLRRGSRGRAVRQWQARMAERGWTLSVDGIFGDGSARVCCEFQREKGLDVDGIVGPDTWKAAWTAPRTP